MHVLLLRERLAIGEDILGLLLLCIGIGSLLTMPLSGAAAVRLGCRKVLTFASLAFAVLLFLLSQVSEILAAVPVLLLFGAVMGCIDVVVNIQAVIVEKASGRRLMSGMHGLWSVGGFAGAGLFGVWVGGLGLSPTASTLIAAGIMTGAILFFARFLLPYGSEAGGRMLAAVQFVIAWYVYRKVL